MLLAPGGVAGRAVVVPRMGRVGCVNGLTHLLNGSGPQLLIVITFSQCRVLLFQLHGDIMPMHTYYWTALNSLGLPDQTY